MTDQPPPIPCAECGAIVPVLAKFSPDKDAPGWCGPCFKKLYVDE